MDVRKRVKARLRELDVLKASAENLHLQAMMEPLEKRRALYRRRRYLQWKAQVMDKALGLLTPEERLVVDLLDIRRAKGNAARLCQILQVEPATVYRRRERAMQKLCMALYGRKR